MRLFFIATIFIAINSFIPYLARCQEKTTYIDTSYFLPSEDNYNLIVAVDLGHLENVKLLLSRGADINASTYEGVTALMYASNNGNLEILSYLIENGAELNRQPINGISALMAAAQGNYFDAAELLITHGANPDIRDIYGVTAVHYAAAYNFYEMTDMLIFYGADPEVSDYEGNTPLLTASYNNCFEAVDILIQNYVNINARDHNGFTSLMLAVQENHHELIKLLISSGAEINAVNKTGVSPLIIAVQNNNYIISEILLQLGAEYDRNINHNIDLIEIARRNKNEELLKLLSSNGVQTLKKPAFSRICFGPLLDFNSTDFMNGFNLGILDSKYNTSLSAGFVFRPLATRIIYPVNADTSFQYWERRYYFYAGSEKRFTILNIGNHNQTGPVIGVKGLLTYGGYRGTYTNPDTRLILSPSAGWFYMNRSLLIHLSYNYSNFQISSIKSGRLNISTLLTLNLKKKSLMKKQIPWLINQ